MRAYLALALAVAPCSALYACSDSGGSSSTSSSSHAASSSGSSSSGAGGASSSSASSASGSSSTSSSGQGGKGSGGSGAGGKGSGGKGAGGAPSCMGGYLDLTVDQAAPVHLTSDCLEDPYAKLPNDALGYEVTHGGQTTLSMFGCDAAMTSQGAFWSFGKPKVGETMLGFVGYRDATDLYGLAGDTIDIKVTKLDAPGGFVDGTFTAKATDTAGKKPAKNLAGTFHVCRLPDVLLP